MYPRPPETHDAPAYQISTHSSNAGLVIADLSNFPAHFKGFLSPDAQFRNEALKGVWGRGQISHFLWLAKIRGGMGKHPSD